MILFPLLIGLLSACAAAPDQWQDFIGDLIGRPAPTVAAPPTTLQPTPTLAAATGSDQPANTPQSETVPPQPTTAATPADEPEAPSEFGPFTGTFEGVMVGANDSSAPLELQLVQRGLNIEGSAALGPGLIIRAGGVCGSFPIPAMTLNAADQMEQASQRTMSTTTNVNVSGFDIPVELNAELSADGETITASATMYPPPLCGSNPTVTATLTRVSP